MIIIKFGAMAPPLKEQLEGYIAEESYLQQIQADADAITRLYLRGLMTDSEAKKARKRLSGAIKARLAELTQEDLKRAARPS